MLAVTVDSGPPGASAFNSLFASVTLCQAGSTTQCQTIDHVLVDTGSSGLRLLSGVLSPALNLRRVSQGGLALVNCVQFVDNSFAWGPLASADIKLGGMTAANVPIQLIGDAAFNVTASACASGTPMISAADLGANGILGLGLFREDCGDSCTNQSDNGSYFRCVDVACTAVTGASVAKEQQLQNPVPLFPSDNNGLLIDLPPVSAAGASSLAGSLIFGVATRSNNQSNGAAALSTDSFGLFTTVLSGQVLDASFVDSGSNADYFPSATLATCSEPKYNGFYCASRSFPVTQRGLNLTSKAFTFSVANAASLFADSSKTVLPGLSGPSGNSASFDWGLPFFYGRRVFFGIDGQTSSLGVGPYYAY